MNYVVTLLASAKRELRKLPRQEIRRIEERISLLAENPRPIGVTKLLGRNNRFRIRVGNYRVLYEIDEESKQVIIFVIAHRKDAYR